MRRGFRKDAHELAVEVRSEIGVGRYDALDPWLLAVHLDIPVWKLSSYSDLPTRAAQVLQTETGTFSAMLAFIGPRRVIVHNDAHAITRQRADVSHELAHALLLHQPQAAVDGQPPRFDLEQEEEARWLGGVLLVLDDFCVACAHRGVAIEVAAAQMGVSEQLMRWRFNMSGARRRSGSPLAA